jgi:aspartokinase-like uncharacterized kinase
MSSVPSPAHADTVVKLGGALLERPRALDLAAQALEAASARGERLLIVPGGGRFANTVREIDRSMGLDPDTAHWTAILGMEQYAFVLAARIRGSRLVRSLAECPDAHSAGLLPVLAPFQWLYAADPLPHTWDVTSDSIAAWIAGQTGAARVLLVKPVTGKREALVDAYFDRVLPNQVRAVITDAEGLTGALREG